MAGLPMACRLVHRFRGSAHSMEFADYAGAMKMAEEDAEQVQRAQQLVKVAIRLGFLEQSQLQPEDSNALITVPLPGMEAALRGTIAYRASLRAAAEAVVRLTALEVRSDEQEAELQAMLQQLRVPAPPVEQPEENVEQQQLQLAAL